MWLATQVGFFSVVIDTTKPGFYLIRARCKADIDNLYCGHVASCPSLTPPAAREDRDYRWRCGISRDDWVKLAGQLADSVTYSNFKNAVHERPDQVNKGRAYLTIWRVMAELQREESPAPPLPPKRKAARKRPN